MRMTVTQWTIVQGVLTDELKERPGARWLDAGIEAKTYGKQWSQEVGIAMHRPDQELVYDALEIIAKGDEKGPIEWPKAILEKAPKWRQKAKATT